MAEQERLEHLEAFREGFKNGLEEMLEMAEFLFDKPKPPDPFSMGFDTRTMDQLDYDEKKIAWELTCQRLGLNSGNLEPMRLEVTPQKLPQKLKYQVKLGLWCMDLIQDFSCNS